MLLCFGAAWPVSILKSWRSRRNGGKSVVFLFVILAGYVFGILNKLFNRIDYVVVFYALNAALVSIDIALYFRNAALESGARVTRSSSES